MACLPRSIFRRLWAVIPMIPLRLAKSASCGVAIDTLADMEDLFAEIDLGSITTSMTINSPAALILAMFIANAEKQGTHRAKLGGTIQNDILKEYQAQKEFIFPPRPSVRIITDMMKFHRSVEMPKWNSISVSGYHIREAGSTAAQELAYTFANGFAYVELRLARGYDGRCVRSSAELLLQCTHRFLRGNRQVPCGPSNLGAVDERALRRASEVNDDVDSTPKPQACR